MLRGGAGLRVRPAEFVAGLRPCFQSDSVDVLVAAMDSLASVHCHQQVNTVRYGAAGGEACVIL